MKILDNGFTPLCTVTGFESRYRLRKLDTALEIGSNFTCFLAVVKPNRVKMWLRHGASGRPPSAGEGILARAAR